MSQCVRPLSPKQAPVAEIAVSIKTAHPNTFCHLTVITYILQYLLVHFAHLWHTPNAAHAAYQPAFFFLRSASSPLLRFPLNPNAPPLLPSTSCPPKTHPSHPCTALHFAERTPSHSEQLALQRCFPACHPPLLLPTETGARRRHEVSQIRPPGRRSRQARCRLQRRRPRRRPRRRLTISSASPSTLAWVAWALAATADGRSSPTCSVVSFANVFTISSASR